MKSSARYFTKTNIAFFTFLITIMLVASIFSLGANDVAHAQDDTFSRIFPSGDYFQAQSPKLIQGNESYLAIYDDAQNALFVFDNNSQSAKVVNLDFQNVEKFLLLDSVAFIIADGNYYTLNLSQDNQAPTQVSIATSTQNPYFTCDGTHLYVHEPSGIVSVYDNALNSVYGASNLQTELYGAIIVAGENDNLYAFTSAYGVALISTLNLSTNEGVATRIEHTVYNAYVGDVIFAKVKDKLSDEQTLVCLDKQDGSLLFETQIEADEFFATGNTLYTIENGAVCVYNLNANHTSLSKLTAITMTGSDENHLNTPSDLVASNGGILVADSKNNRLSTITSTSVNTTQFDESPIAICNGGAFTYAVFENKLARVSNGQIAKTYDVENVLDATYLDKLYVLTQDGVYTIIGDSAFRLLEIQGAKRIASAVDGKNVYLLKEDCVTSITPQGKLLPNTVEGDFSNAVDIAVDYQGKIFVAYKNSIESHLNGSVNTIELTSNTLNATLTSISLDGEKIYFTTKESFVGMLSVDAKTKATYSASQVDISTCTDCQFVVPKDAALYYPADGRLDGISFADDSTLLLLNGVECDGSYAYALNSDKIVKIALSQFESVQTSALSGEYVALDKIKLYSLPYQNQGSIEIEKDTKINLVSDVAGYDGDTWALCEYQSNTYFVKRSQIEKHVEIIPEKDKVYGKANADRVGGIVNVYTSADLQSDVILQIIDGQEVEVFEELEGFYLVSVDGTLGYVVKEQLKIEGLTTVQIVAIVLAIIVALAGCAIFASIYLTKKNNEEKDKEKQGRFIR